jgi:hypothetical protein
MGLVLRYKDYGEVEETENSLGFSSLCKGSYIHKREGIRGVTIVEQ